MHNLKLAPFRQLIPVLLLALVSLFVVSPLHAQQATFNNGLLTLPEVSFNGIFYRAELTLLNGTNPSEFQLTAATQILGVLDPLTTTYANGNVLIPSVLVNGVRAYWARLTLINPISLTFRLGSAELDDNDDDNDTVADQDDLYPYVANAASDPLNLNGTWRLFFKVVQTGGVCSGDPIFSAETLTFKYNSIAHAYDVSGNVSNAGVVVANKTFTISGTFSDGTGITTREAMTLTIAPESTTYNYMSMSGTELWSWRGPSGQCLNSSSQLWGTKDLQAVSPPLGIF